MHNDNLAINEFIVSHYKIIIKLLAHIIPGLLLILLTYVGSNPYVCVAIITLSLGFNGASTVTNLQNAQDLAPNYVCKLITEFSEFF